MKLNKSQRHFIYCLLLAELSYKGIRKQIKQRNGFCHFIGYITGIYPVNKKPEVDEVKWNDYFPEIRKRKPRIANAEGFWFDRDFEGWNQRIEVLKQCIAETA